MQSIMDDRNYECLVKDILLDKDFNKMKDIRHHGMNRYDHSLRVSYYSYKIAKALKLDYESTARAGLLHDFFFVDNEEISIGKRGKTLVEHPSYALENAKSKFILNDKEENIIESHMFPVSLHLPRYLESWIVDLVDDGVAIWEAYKAHSTQLKPIANLMALISILVLKKQDL